MLKKINRCDIYIIITFLYSMQGLLYPQGIINQLLQFAQIAIAGVETLNLLTKRMQSPILKITFLMVLMYCMYGLWIIVSDPIILYSDGHRARNFPYLQKSLRSLLPIFMFYYYTRIGLLKEERIRIYAMFFLVMSFKSFFQNKTFALEEYGREESTNNAAYSFVNLIPTVYFFRKKPILQYILLGVLGVFILMGMKRGAILIGGFSILIFMYSNLKGTSLKNKIITFTLAIGFIIGTVYFVEYMLQTNDYFIYRIEKTVEGDSSHRNVIYASLWDIFINTSNPLHIIFGYGANATIDLIGIEAHNDWLETLINNGLIGGVILLFFFIILAKTVYKQRNRFPSYMYYSFIILVFIIFSKTIFSMSIQSIGGMHSLLLGYFAYWSTQPKGEVQNLINDKR